VILSLEKITIGFSKGKMVGHIVSKNGVAIIPEKLDMISMFFFPTIKWWVIIEGSYTCLRQKHVL
jgi:hypothetical protein